MPGIHNHNWYVTIMGKLWVGIHSSLSWSYEKLWCPHVCQFDPQYCWPDPVLLFWTQVLAVSKTRSAWLVVSPFKQWPVDVLGMFARIVLSGADNCDPLVHHGNQDSETKTFSGKRTKSYGKSTNIPVLSHYYPTIIPIKPL